MIDESFTGHCPTCGQTYHGWQPIETAPRDGTAVLVYQPPKKDDDLPAVIQVARYEASSANPPVFRWVEAEGEGYETYSPTHWMPLPPPPSNSEGRE